MEMAAVPMLPTPETYRSQEEFLVDHHINKGAWIHHTVQIYQYPAPPDAPFFPPVFYSVARRDTLTKFVMGRTRYCVVELHIAEHDNERFYRILLHCGISESKEPRHTTRECLFAFTVTDALALYGSIVREKLSPLQLYKRVLMTPDGVEDSNFAPISLLKPAIQDLVKVFLQETALSLSHDKLRLGHVTSPQIDKALIVLHKIKNVFVHAAETRWTNEDHINLLKLSQEFFSALPLPHSPERTTVDTPEDLAHWFETCQMLKDVAGLGEVSIPLNVAHEGHGNVDLLCHSLMVDIDHLDPTSTDFKSLEAIIMKAVSDQENHSNMQFSICNIFSLTKRSDFELFSHSMPNRHLLFHGSRIGNWLGILSRGVLLPNVVESQLSVSRTNIGMLGCGIYFSDSFLSSIKYTTGSSSGTRFMLVCEVALGKVKDFEKFSTGLLSPPTGYDSCHGVKSHPDRISEFDDDEYVIYSSSQQYMKYLVEFSLVSDSHRQMQPESPVFPLCFTSERRVVDAGVNLKQTEKPAVQEKCGLLTASGSSVPLQSTSIHVRLVDMVGEVVILQQYYNEGDITVEAKYVFPLDEMSAVTGFEAFINNKHIIGVVKEKEAAHKEYKEAVERGDGAYLLDEAPKSNAFTLSVGNLPPRTKVIILIRYITELGMEGDRRKFAFPANLVASQRHGASKELTQATTSTVHVHKQAEDDSFEIEIAISMPHVIQEILSSSHSLKYKQSSNRATVLLLDPAPFEIDFVLLLRLCDVHTPRLWIESAEDQEHAAMVTFFPNFSSSTSPTDMEYIILVDQSSSMSEMLSNVRLVARQLLQGIPNMACFNVVNFGSSFDTLFTASVIKTEINEAAALSCIDIISCNWGASLLWPVLKSILLLVECRQEYCQRQHLSFRGTNVFLLTDGDYLNEDQVAQLVRNHCSRNGNQTRIFPFGIGGSTLNRYNVMQLARLGAGASEFVGPSYPLDKQVKLQLQRSYQPSLSNISVEWETPEQVIQAPGKILSLFHGERTIIYAFVPPECTKVTIAADSASGSESYSESIITDSASILRNTKLIHRLATRSFVRDWESSFLGSNVVQSELEKEKNKGEVIRYGCKYSLATPLTSFIAVEERSEEEKTGSAQLPDTPPLADIASKEKVDELPFVSNWKEYIKPTPEQLKDLIGKRRLSYHSISEFWSPALPEIVYEDGTRDDSEEEDGEWGIKCGGYSTTKTSASLFRGLARSVGKRKSKMGAASHFSAGKKGRKREFALREECEFEDFEMDEPMECLEMCLDGGGPSLYMNNIEGKEDEFDEDLLDARLQLLQDEISEEEVIKKDVTKKPKPRAKVKEKEKADGKPPREAEPEMKFTKKEKEPEMNFKQKDEKKSAPKKKKKMKKQMDKDRLSPGPPPPMSKNIVSSPPPGAPACAQAAAAPMGGECFGGQDFREDLGTSIGWVENGRFAHGGGGRGGSVTRSSRGDYRLASDGLHDTSTCEFDGDFYNCSGFASQSRKAKKAACFVATAAYGSSLHPSLGHLRDFRDDVLLKLPGGNTFVDCYYRFSPSFARWVHGREWAKVCVRTTLWPVVWAMQNRSFALKLAFCVIALVFVIILHSVSFV